MQVKLIISKKVIQSYSGINFKEGSGQIVGLTRKLGFPNN